MESADRIAVEVAYACPDEQVIMALEVPAGTTLEQAVQQSGILERFPEIDLSSAKMGIFGKLNKRDYVLRPGDRVEIYRPLIADPKEIRKQRAAEGKRMKRGGGDIDPDSGKSPGEG
ncbi:MAG: RnfH family protein [Gammaproteobacteria bacterium]